MRWRYVSLARGSVSTLSGFSATMPVASELRAGMSANSAPSFQTWETMSNTGRLIFHGTAPRTSSPSKIWSRLP